MHCWVESWMSSYHIGTTDSIHLTPSIDFMNLYEKKEKRKKKKTSYACKFCRCESKGNTEMKGCNALFDILLWLTLLSCVSTDEVHHHFMLTATGHFIPVLTQHCCHCTVAVCKMFSWLFLYAHAGDPTL